LYRSLKRRLLKAVVPILVVLIIGGTFVFYVPTSANADTGQSLVVSSASGLQGSSITLKDTSLASAETYIVCFSTAYYYCSLSTSIPNVQDSLTGSSLIAGVSETVPLIAGGQYFLVLISPTSVFVTDTEFTITPSAITYPLSAGVGSANTLKATNLAGSSSYTVCFETAPTTGCSSGPSDTGTALASGVSVTVPDLSNGLYYLNIESATSPASSFQIVSSSTVEVTSSITLGAASGAEGASVTIKVSSLASASTYTVCFSQAYYYCSVSTSVTHVSYSITGSTLKTGTTLTVPEISGGQYYVVILSPTSTFVTSAVFTILGSVITYPASGASPSTPATKMKATNLVASATYIACFVSSPTSGCSSGTSATGSAFASGVTVPVPSGLTSGQYYATLESVTSPPSSLQIVAVSPFVVTGGTTSVETLGAASGLGGASVTVKATNLVSTTTYTVCFSTAYYYCSISSSVPNDQVSLTGSVLTTGTTLTVPLLGGGQYYVVIYLSSLVAVGAYYITASVASLPNSAGVGTAQTLKATNLATATTYTICFENNPTTGCSTGTSATGSALATGVSVTIPDETPGLYYLNIESAVSPASSAQIVAVSSPVLVVSITPGATGGAQGASVTLKASSLVSAETYTVCFSTAYYYCSISSSVPNAVYTLTGSALSAGTSVTVPKINGGPQQNGGQQYFIILESPSPTVMTNAAFVITQSVITSPTTGTAGVGSTQTVKATNLVGAATYTICLTNSPTTGCASGQSATGTALGTGVSYVVPDLTPALYFLNIESATSPASQAQIVSVSSLVVTSAITLGSNNAIEGTSVSIKVSSLNPTGSYTVCFSQANYYCSVSNSIPDVQYTFTGSTLKSGTTVVVPEIIGGPYYLVLLNSLSTVITYNTYRIYQVFITFPSNAAVGSSNALKVTNLVSTATYTLCFETSPTTGCSTGPSATGSTLAAGTYKVTIPDLPNGVIFLNIESATNPNSFQIVATAAIDVSSVLT
jgi:hypothetical protein